MKLPETIKLGHRQISVEYTDKLWYDQRIRSDLNVDAHYITIDSSCALDMQKRSLFLNILYAGCTVIWTAHEKKDILENIILAMFVVFRDNPVLLEPGMANSIKSLRILGVAYDVSDDYDGDENARINHLQHTIRYNSSVPLERLYQSFIHEIVHAIIDQLSLEDIGEADTHRVAWMTSMLFNENDFSWVNDEEQDT